MLAKEPRGIKCEGLSEDILVLVSLPHANAQQSPLGDQKTVKHDIVQHVAHQALALFQPQDLHNERLACRFMAARRIRRFRSDAV